MRRGGVECTLYAPSLLPVTAAIQCEVQFRLRSLASAELRFHIIILAMVTACKVLKYNLTVPYT